MRQPARRRSFGLLRAVLAARLGGGRAVPDGLLEGVDGAALVGLAGRHAVTPALAAAVEDLGLAGRLPEDVALYLALVRAGNGRRNRALRAQLAEAVGRLNEAGIEPVLLKGAIRLVDGLYPDPSWRLMADLDLLVPGGEDALAAARDALARAGYAERPFWPCPHHLPPLARPGRPAQIELHRAPLPTPFDRLPPAAEMEAQGASVTFDGARARVPAPAHQLVHLIAHAQLHHGQYAAGRFALRDAVEAARLVAAAGPGLLEAVRAAFREAGRGRVGAVALAVFARALPGCLGGAAGGTDGWTRLLAGRVLSRQHRGAPETRAGRVAAHLSERLLRLVLLPEDRQLLARGLLERDFYRRQAAWLRRELTAEPGAPSGRPGHRPEPPTPGAPRGSADGAGLPRSVPEQVRSWTANPQSSRPRE